MAADPLAPTSSESSVRLWRIDPGGGLAALGMTVFACAVVGAATGFLLKAIAAPVQSASSAIGVILGMGIAACWSNWRTRRALAAACAAATCLDDLERLAPAVLKRIGYPAAPFGLGPLDDLARQMLRLGAAGRCYWVSRPQAAAPALTPITLAFEPVPLVRGALAPDAPERAAGLRGQIEDHLGGLRHAAAPRTMLVLSTVGLIGAIGSLGFLLVDTVVSLMRGSMPGTWASLAVPLAFLIVILLARAIWARNCVAIPGGLVLRTASGYQSTWTLRRFVPADSVILYWADAYLLTVASGDGSALQMMLSRPLAEIAFRAWLSPLAAPPLDRVSDLK